MTNTSVQVNFLDGEFKRKAQKWTHIFVLSMLVFNMSFMGVFFVAEPAEACHGTITVNKVTVPEGSEEDFDFEGSGPRGWSKTATLSDGESAGMSFSVAGTYVISEEAKKDWQVTEIECSDNYNYEVDLDKGEVSIYIPRSGDVECTFYNTEEESKDECVEELGPEYFTVAKWEWEDGWYEELDKQLAPYVTSVSGSAESAEWFSEPAVAAVLAKEATDYYEHPGGTGGTIDKSSEHDLSHLTFCGGEIEEECILELIKTDNPDPVNPGGDLTYTLTLTNVGTADCTGSGVKLKEHYDENTSFVSSDPSPTEGDDLWVYDVLHPGDSVTVEILTTVSEEAECESTLINEACVWAKEKPEWACVEETTTIECEADCGDGYPDPGEECDLGNENGVVCDPLYNDSCSYCTETCEWESVPGPYCGDGVWQEQYEECEGDFGVGPNQSCSSECELIDLKFCGNYIVEDGEDCDDGPNGSETCSADCTYNPVTIKAYKVVCEAEEYLPNWALSGTQNIEPSTISETTAEDYVAYINDLNEDEVCWLAPDWGFEWGFDGEAEKQAGDHIGPAPDGTGWQAFDSLTGISNPAEKVIETDPGNKLWVREILTEGYIPYANPPAGLQEDYSAEMHCHTDILNFDNYDYINNPEWGGTYYCVAFNAPIPEPTEGSLIVKKLVVGGEAVSSDWTMYISDITSFPGSPAGVSTVLEEGMYQVTESVGPDNYLLTYSGDCGEAGHVEVVAGETRTCVLTNTYNEVPQVGHLKVTKLVVGGNAEPSDWTMNVGSTIHFPGTADGHTITIGTGMWVVSETGEVENYELTFSGDCDSEGNVEVEDGETKHCVLTNTYVPPRGSIEVCKYIDEDGSNDTNDDRSLAVDTAWSFDLNYDETSHVQDTVEGCTVFTELLAGDYNLSELIPTGWYLVDPLENNVQITLAEGEDKTYDFVNAEEVPETPVIRGCKYNDANNNSSIDEGEVKLEGWTIELMTCPFAPPQVVEALATDTSGEEIAVGGCEVSQTMVTDESGCYEFNDLGTGWYKVQEQMQSGWSQTFVTNPDAFWFTEESEDAVIDFANYKEPPEEPFCGNNIKEAGEECDGTDVPSGRSCNSNCTLSPGGGGGGRIIPPTTTVVSEVPGEPVLVIEKSIDLPFANAGDVNIPYKIVVTNNGDDDAIEVNLTDDLPEGFSYAGTDSGFKVWNLGDLEAGNFVVIEYQVDIALDVVAGIYTNTATVSAGNHEAVMTTADLEVRTVQVLAETGLSVEELMATILLLLLLAGTTQALRKKLA